MFLREFLLQLIETTGDLEVFFPQILENVFLWEDSWFSSRQAVKNKIYGNSLRHH